MIYHDHNEAIIWCVYFIQCFIKSPLHKKKQKKWRVRLSRSWLCGQLIGLGSNHSYKTFKVFVHHAYYFCENILLIRVIKENFPAPGGKNEKNTLSQSVLNQEMVTFVTNWCFDEYGLTCGGASTGFRGHIGTGRFLLPDPLLRFLIRIKPNCIDQNTVQMWTENI